jgi:hypothetical protein
MKKTYEILKDGKPIKNIFKSKQYCIDMVNWYHTSFAHSNHKYEVREIETHEIDYTVEPIINY